MTAEAGRKERPRPFAEDWTIAGTLVEIGAGRRDLDDLRRAAIERGQPLSAPQIDIVVSTLGGDANLLGAARIAFDELEEGSS